MMLTIISVLHFLLIHSQWDIKRGSMSYQFKVLVEQQGMSLYTSIATDLFTSHISFALVIDEMQINTA